MNVYTLPYTTFNCLVFFFSLRYLLQSSPCPVAIKLNLALKWSRILEIAIFLLFYLNLSIN